MGVKDKKKWKLAKDFDRKANRLLYDTCRECQHPPCSICGETIGPPEMWVPNKYNNKQTRPVCQKCKPKSRMAKDVEKKGNICR